MPDLSEATQSALLLLVGAAVFEIGREMRECTPNMESLRNATDRNDSVIKQHLIDGQVHTGILVLGAAVIATWVTLSLIPALVLALVYAGLVWYQHDILAAPAVGTY